MQDPGSLYNFVPHEVSPPNEVWTRIASALKKVGDSGTLNHLADTEVEPPAIVWQNIREELDRGKVITLPGQVSKSKKIWLKLALAGCFTSIIFLVSQYFYSDNSTEKMGGSVSGIVNSNGRNAKDTQEIIQNLPGYLIVTSPNGNRVRISDKLAEMIPFLNYTDPAFSKNNTWKRMFNQWSATIYNAAANPVLVNFADPIDLIRFLQTKK